MYALGLSLVPRVLKDKSMQLHIRACITAFSNMTQKNVTCGHGNANNILCNA